MPRRMILIRGLPGSGKSTYAMYLQDAYNKIDKVMPMWAEADHRMHDDEGNYLFDPTLLEFVHKECWKDAQRAAIEGLPCIIVSNTFSQLWEIKPYKELAMAYGYTFDVIKVTSQYGNTHNVPEATIQKMKDRWQYYEGESINADTPKPGVKFRV